MTLGPDFMWGVALSSHQNDGGAPESDWSHAEARGRLPARCVAGTAFREHLESDLDLAQALGTNAFRTSIEWARLEPRPGQWDAREVDYLHRLFDAVRARGMRLVATLHHFTSPRWIYDGFYPTGWESRRVAERFARYAEFVAREFGDAIDFYLTFNEPTNMLAGGYGAGKLPPFRANPVSLLAAARGVIRAHELAYDAIHAVRPGAMVSFSDFTAIMPLPGLMLDLMPGRLISPFARRVEGTNGKLRPRHLDYVSLHYYGLISFRDANAFPIRPYNFRVDPDHFHRILHAYHQAYDLPILIGENGLATYNHAPRSDGWTASRYMLAHVEAMQRARAEGVPLLGYMYWTLTDSYEWGTYDARFGLYRVDCESGDFTRHATPAVETYRHIIRANGAPPDWRRDPGLA